MFKYSLYIITQNCCKNRLFLDAGLYIHLLICLFNTKLLNALNSLFPCYRSVTTAVRSSTREGHKTYCKFVNGFFFIFLHIVKCIKLQLATVNIWLVNGTSGIQVSSRGVHVHFKNLTENLFLGSLQNTTSSFNLFSSSACL